ncbi:hypothetical protein GQ607_008116 [Colletotrichum asianum]|uniref:Uncharacterized protein n=1 Tax=Colletotrichum asianum TaxID=702518 RepID=A0A8H3WHG6_9PEZI|nr:hypothetical protein GQ607_008116 [Colletotrichum asianum]
MLQVTVAASNFSEIQLSEIILETDIVEFDGKQDSKYDSVGEDLWNARPFGGTNKGILRLANIRMSVTSSASTTTIPKFASGPMRETNAPEG